MKGLIGLGIAILCILLMYGRAFSGDYHQDDSQHAVVYTVTDASGNHVTGQTIRLTLYRPSDNKYYDFSDNTFDNLSSVTTLHRSLTENATSGMYFTTVTVDNATLVSADVVITVSNDDGTYGDQQSESVYFDRLEQIVKIHR